MCSPQHSQDPDPEIPVQDEPSDPHPQSQSEPQTMEEESQNPRNPESPKNEESQKVILEEEVVQNHQEDPKSSLEENPDQQSSGKALSLSPAAVHVDVPPPSVGGDMTSAPLTSPTNPPRRLPKRKKGKCNTKRQQAIDKRLNTLMGKLHPIPFIPSKILDFSSHEKLLKELGLWDFIHIDLNQKVRIDLIAQLVATYDSKMRCSYVNGFRINTTRADLARALKLPVKKEKGGANTDTVDVDAETLSDEAIGFLEDFVSIWVLLHDDTWLMPSEVYNWIGVIKDGNPEKVDWARLLWFMVEKELAQGEQLGDCYYAVHLQYLIKSQRDEVFQNEENSDVKVGGATEVQEDESELRGPNIQLSLGQDLEKTEEVKDAEMMDVEEHVEEQQQQEEEQEQEQWPLDEKNEVDEPCLRLCSTSKESMIVDDCEEKKEESEALADEEGVVEGECGEEQEREDEFGVLQNDDTLGEDGLTGNLLQTMEMSQIPFTSDEHLHDQSQIEFVASRTDLNTSGPSTGYGSKRQIECDLDGDIANGGNKRLRMDEPWDDKQPNLDLGTCFDQMGQLMTRARMMYEEKEHEVQELNIHKQVLFEECNKREAMLTQFYKNKQIEITQRDNTIYRLERELFLMGNIVEGYRKALKATHNAFAEYRKSAQAAQLPEEPIYKDAGPGGLVLTTAEAEKLRLKQEEEYRSNCLMLELKAKEAEEGYAAEFEVYLDKVTALGIRLMSVSANLEELKEVYAKLKSPETQPKVPEAPDAPAEE